MNHNQIQKLAIFKTSEGAVFVDKAKPFVQSAAFINEGVSAEVRDLLISAPLLYQALSLNYQFFQQNIEILESFGEEKFRVMINMFIEQQNMILRCQKTAQEGLPL